MAPTPLAQSLIIPVRAALAQLRAAIEEKTVFDPSESKRAFHILANDYVEIMLLAPLSASLWVQAGGISLHIYRPRSLFQPPAAAALADSFDLALGFFPDALTLDASVHSELLWEENNVCIARAKHPQIRGGVTLKQYAAAGHVAVFYKSQGQGLIDSLLEQQGYSRKQMALVPHFASVPFIVAASDLIATAPERLAKRFAHLKLQVLPVPLAIPPFRLTMLWHERYDRDPAHLWLRDLIATTSKNA
jgi:DNA-binding transcriptional LysR family regulator